MPSDSIMDFELLKSAVSEAKNTLTLHFYTEFVEWLKDEFNMETVDGYCDMCDKIDPDLCHQSCENYCHITHKCDNRIKG